ncbi:MAG: hypothetical protein KJZ80_16090 [Hyphomicrobiaceae bacterium]|nr:hypothetical protein [Hyphomicrobiaceae bacterium]
MQEHSISGRILRPRQFVPTPQEWTRHGHTSENWDGRIVWNSRWRHPEIDDLVARHEALIAASAMTKGEWAISARIEALFLFAEDAFAWWVSRMDHGRLLPDSQLRPEPEAVIGRMPSWETFVALLGASHRARAWIEAVERRHGIDHPTAREVWAREYGIDASEVEGAR